MPNRYEREIEEILRNMERTEPRQGFSDRLRAFNRPRTRTRRPVPPTVTLTRMELALIVGIALALVGAAVAYYFQGTSVIASLISGVLGVIAFVIIVMAFVSAWSVRFRGTTPSHKSGWRSGNVIDMTPRRRRNPFSGMVTQARILRLKLRYRRRRPHEVE